MIGMSGQNKASSPSALTAKQISFLVVAVVVFVASLVTSYHYHSDLQTRSACAVCKSAQQLAAGETQDPLLPTPQKPDLIAYISPDTVIFISLVTLPGQTRAPPRS
ncbi:MAG: hypothetical protein A2010_18375 [Nitrospirae bacterium GWD2_57_9]|nr:MAG: hypothetical protein A2010_18375 [Nitrospirae bacterium GWD2_57_9]